MPKNTTMQKTKDNPTKLAHGTIAIPPQVYEWITHLAANHHQEPNIILDNIIDHCLNDPEFSSFLSPFLPVIATNNTAENLEINHLQNLDQLAAFSQSLEANQKKILILMVCFTLSKSEADPAPTKEKIREGFATVKIPLAEYTALKQTAQSKGLTMIDLFAEMVAYAQENPSTHYPLAESIIASRQVFTIPRREVYKALQGLSRTLNAPVIDTASGLISHCLKDSDFLLTVPDSPTYTLKVPQPLAEVFYSRANELGLTFDEFTRDLLSLTRIDTEFYPPVSSAKSPVEITEGTIELLRRFQERYDWTLSATLSAILAHWRLKMSL